MEVIMKEISLLVFLVTFSVKAAYLTKNNIKLNSRKAYKVKKGDRLNLNLERSMFADKISFKVKCKGEAPDRAFDNFNVRVYNRRHVNVGSIVGPMYKVRGYQNYELNLKKPSYIKGLSISPKQFISGALTRSKWCKIKKISVNKFFGNGRPDVSAGTDYIFGVLDILSQDLTELRDFITTDQWKEVNQLRTLVDDVLILSTADSGLALILSATKKVISSYMKLKPLINSLRSDESARYLVNNIITNFESLEDSVY